MHILTIDIGGSNIKAMILNEDGAPVSEYKKTETPAVATPINVLEAIRVLVKDFTTYDKISAGFPAI